jgi:uncharacterized protein YbbC (DUF1343 family)
MQRWFTVERWIDQANQLELTVIPIAHFSRDQRFELALPPSPNLPNLRSVLLYPSLCFFEGMHVSVGRGTDYPFQVMRFPENNAVPFHSLQGLFPEKAYILLF